MNISHLKNHFEFLTSMTQFKKLLAASVALLISSYTQAQPQLPTEKYRIPLKEPYTTKPITIQVLNNKYIIPSNYISGFEPQSQKTKTSFISNGFGIDLFLPNYEGHTLETRQKNDDAVIAATQYGWSDPKSKNLNAEKVLRVGVLADSKEYRTKTYNDLLKKMAMNLDQNIKNVDNSKPNTYFKNEFNLICYVSRRYKYENELDDYSLHKKCFQKNENDIVYIWCFQFQYQNYGVGCSFERASKNTSTNAISLGISFAHSNLYQWQKIEQSVQAKLKTFRAK